MKTLEGIELKSVKHFPSMEWGPKGGTSCTIWYQGKKAFEFFNEGNGGCAHITQVGDITEKEFDKIAMQVHARLDPVSQTQYSPEILAMEPIDSMVENLLNLLDNEKQFKKYVKQGYPYVLVVVYRRFRVFSTASKIDDKDRLLNNLCISEKIDPKDPELEVSYYRSLEDFDRI